MRIRHQFYVLKPLKSKSQLSVSGFYEWKALDGELKQPYLIYAHQESDEMSQKVGVVTELNENENGSKTELNETENGSKTKLNETKISSKSKTCQGPKPLFMAGIFSVWHAMDDHRGKKKPIYSYTVITR